MRKAVRRISVISILFVITCVLIGIAENSLHEKYNERRKVIIKQCELALPVLTQRYEACIPLLELCEKQDAWTDSFEIYQYEAPPAFIGGNQTGEAEPAEENRHDLRRFLGRTIVKKHFVASVDNDYSNVASHAFGVGLQEAVFDTNSGSTPVIIDFTALHDGVIRFTTGTSAFAKVMGATEIEFNLPKIMTVATNFDAINSSGLMVRIKSEAATSGPVVSAMLSTVTQSVEQYNSDLAHSLMARMMTIPPITMDSQLITWEAGNAPN